MTPLHLALPLLLAACAPRHRIFVIANEAPLVYSGRIWPLPFIWQPSQQGDWADLAMNPALTTELDSCLRDAVGISPASIRLQNYRACADLGPGWTVSFDAQGREVEVLVCCEPYLGCAVFGHPHDLQGIPYFAATESLDPVGDVVIPATRWYRRFFAQIRRNGPEGPE